MTDQPLRAVPSETTGDGKVIYSTRVVSNKWSTVQTRVDARSQVAQDVAMALYSRLLNGEPALVKVVAAEWDEGEDNSLTFIQHRATWTPYKESQRVDDLLTLCYRVMQELSPMDVSSLPESDQLRHLNALNWLDKGMADIARERD